MMVLKDHITSEDLIQAKAAKLVGLTQPRISVLMRGTINFFTIDTQINMLAATGMKIDVLITKQRDLIFLRRASGTGTARLS